MPDIFRVTRGCPTGVNREQGPGLAVYVLAELGGIDAVRVARDRRIPIPCCRCHYGDGPCRGPGLYSRTLLGLYHLSWGK